MDKRILYTSDQGTMHIILPNPDCGLTIEQIAEKDVPEGRTFEIVDVADIPVDRTFRNAWTHGAGKKVAIDLEGARSITHDRRRTKRTAEFAPLDVEATIPAKAAEAEAKRQVIRDRHASIQIGIDDATTPEQLKAIIDANAL